MGNRPDAHLTLFPTERQVGGPLAFDAETYKQRYAVERRINRFKRRRGLAMRTDKLAIAHQAALGLAAILIWR
jgi:transposase